MWRTKRAATINADHNRARSLRDPIITTSGLNSGDYSQTNTALHREPGRQLLHLCHFYPNGTGTRIGTFHWDKRYGVRRVTVPYKHAPPPWFPLSPTSLVFPGQIVRLKARHRILLALSGMPTGLGHQRDRRFAQRIAAELLDAGAIAHHRYLILPPNGSRAGPCQYPTNARWSAIVA